MTWKNSIILGPCKLSSSSQFFTSHTTHILDIVPRVPSLYSCLFTEEVGRVLSARLEDLIDCEENSVIEIRDCGVEIEAENPQSNQLERRKASSPFFSQPWSHHLRTSTWISQPSVGFAGNVFHQMATRVR